MDSWCRVCSRNDDFRRFPLYAVAEVSQEVIANMLTNVTDTQVSSEDGLPQQICPDCLITLSLAYSFRRLCRRNDAKFRESYEGRAPSQSADPRRSHSHAHDDNSYEPIPAIKEEVEIYDYDCSVPPHEDQWVIQNPRTIREGAMAIVHNTSQYYDEADGGGGGGPDPSALMPLTTLGESHDQLDLGEGSGMAQKGEKWKKIPPTPERFSKRIRRHESPSPIIATTPDTHIHEADPDWTNVSHLPEEVMSSGGRQLVLNPAQQRCEYCKKKMKKPYKHRNGKCLTPKGKNQSRPRCVYCHMTFIRSNSIPGHLRSSCRVYRQVCRMRGIDDFSSNDQTLSPIPSISDHIPERPLSPVRIQLQPKAVEQKPVLTKTKLKREIRSECQNCKLTFENRSAFVKHQRACKMVKQQQKKKIVEQIVTRGSALAEVPKKQPEHSREDKSAIIKVHLEKQSVEEETKCVYCTQPVSKKTRFQHHNGRCVLGRLNSEHPCPYCPMAFSSRSNLLRHQRERCEQYHDDHEPSPDEIPDDSMKTHAHATRLKSSKQNKQTPVKETPVKASPASVKSTPISVKSIPISVKTTPAPVKITPVSIKTTPVSIKTTHVPIKTTPVSIKTTPVSIKTTPISVKTTSVPVKTTSIPIKPAPTPEKATPAKVKATSTPVKTTPISVKTTPAKQVEDVSSPKSIVKRTFCKYCQQRVKESDRAKHSERRCIANRLSNSQSAEYSCGYCRKAFAMRDSLVEHQRVCTVRKLHKQVKCQFCGSTISNRGNLRKHQKVYCKAIPRETSGKSEQENEEQPPKRQKTVKKIVKPVKKVVKATTKKTKQYKKKNIRIESYQSPKPAKRPASELKEKKQSDPVSETKQKKKLQPVSEVKVKKQRQSDSEPKRKKPRQLDSEPKAKKQRQPVSEPKEKKQQQYAPKKKKKLLKRRIRCKYCDQLFKSEVRASNHTLKCSAKQQRGEFVCKFCSERFTSQSKMYNHRRLECKAAKLDEDGVNDSIENCSLPEKPQLPSSTPKKTITAVKVPDLSVNTPHEPSLQTPVDENRQTVPLADDEPMEEHMEPRQEDKSEKQPPERPKPEEESMAIDNNNAERQKDPQPEPQSISTPIEMEEESHPEEPESEPESAPTPIEMEEEPHPEEPESDPESLPAPVQMAEERHPEEPESDPESVPTPIEMTEERHREKPESDPESVPTPVEKAEERHREEPESDPKSVPSVPTPVEKAEERHREEPESDPESVPTPVEMAEERHREEYQVSDAKSVPTVVAEELHRSEVEAELHPEEPESETESEQTPIEVAAELHPEDPESEPESLPTSIEVAAELYPEDSESDAESVQSPIEVAREYLPEKPETENESVPTPSEMEEDYPEEEHVEEIIFEMDIEPEEVIHQPVEEAETSN